MNSSEPNLSLNVFRTRNTYTAAFLASTKEIPLHAPQPLLVVEDGETGHTYQVWQFVTEHKGIATKDLAEEFESNQILDNPDEDPIAFAVAAYADTYKYFVKHIRNAHPLVEINLGKKIILTGKGSKQHKALCKEHPHLIQP